MKTLWLLTGLVGTFGCSMPVEEDPDVAIERAALTGGGDYSALGIASSDGGGYGWSSHGGALTFTRTALGRYRVDIAGIGGAGGNVQLSAADTNDRPVRCLLDSFWPRTEPSGPVMQIFVHCTTPTGALTDSNVSMIFQRNSWSDAGNQKGAYVWNNLPSSSGTPDRAYQWSSNGGVSTVTYRGTGRYDVFLPGFTTASGAAYVTGYEAGGRWCKTAGWSAKTSGTTVDVRCFEPSGAPANARFTLVFTNTGPAISGLGARAWIGTPGYIGALSGPYAYSDVGGAIEQSGSSVTFHRLPYDVRGTLLVQAYGAAPIACTGRANAPFNATQLQAACFDVAGRAVTSQWVSGWSIPTY